MPHTMEHIRDAYNQEAALYSLSQYYSQNGDLMRDPEVVFVVVDHRTETDKAVGEVQ